MECHLIMIKSIKIEFNNCKKNELLHYDYFSYYYIFSYYYCVTMK